jgi:hypothetical protein
MSKIQATARVQITVEVQTESPWGEECDIGQLYKQAGEESVAKLKNYLNKSGLPVRIIGDAKVIGIITEKQ